MIVPASDDEAAQFLGDANALCPACGAPLGGRAGCQTAFDALCARVWEAPERGAAHNLAVDAYCLQHPEDYCVSAKSYAAHLAGLACGLAPAGAQSRYFAIARWLDGARSLERPTPPAERGAVTIAAVSGGGAGATYGTAVRAWAEAVWRAYAAQHALAERWLADALAAAEHAGARRTPGRSGAPAP
ncbi:MAG TPA: DUF5946 family protein [Gemmatimonadaceae bacterium]|nr:DUF5946 family protein [Gemmatimonadaceae bacterium]